MLLLGLAVVALGIVAMTAAVTTSEYDNLPERIPTHFGFDGAPNAYGPRWAIWIIVVAQIVACVSFAQAVSALRNGGTAPTPFGFGVFAICILALLAHVQLRLIAAAKSPEPHFPTGRFVAVAVALTALAVLSMRFL